MISATDHREGDAPVTYPDDPDLRARVLVPYRAHCRYLRTAEVRSSGGVVSLDCVFAIGESWYIQDTGHFNAVEFNLCYNQAVYYLIAKCVQDRLLPAFAEWELADYWRRQLSDVLIVRYASRFRRPIQAERVSAEVRFDRVTRRRVRQDAPPLLLIETTCRFWDDRGGKCDGTVTIAVTNPPTAGP